MDLSPRQRDITPIGQVMKFNESISKTGVRQNVRKAIKHIFSMFFFVILTAGSTESKQEPGLEICRKELAEVLFHLFSLFFL